MSWVNTDTESATGTPVVGPWLWITEGESPSELRSPTGLLSARKESRVAVDEISFPAATSPDVSDVLRGDCLDRLFTDRLFAVSEAIQTINERLVSSSTSTLLTSLDRILRPSTVGLATSLVGTPLTALSDALVHRFTCHVDALMTEVVEANAAVAAPSLRAKVHALFSRCTDENFEAGMESPFSHELEELVKSYGAAPLRESARLIDEEKLGANVLAEALRWLGLMDDRNTEDERLQLLTRCLRHQSPIVRDSATLGLTYMEDPRAIAPITEAIRTETVSELREDMVAALAELTSDPDALSP
jgi:hypothetical protein